MHSVTSTIFPVFAFIVTHRVILLTRFCKLLTRVATLSEGGGHVPQVPQWHDASGGFAYYSSTMQQKSVQHMFLVCDDMIKQVLICSPT